MATAKKKVTAVKTTTTDDRKITYRVTRINYNETTTKFDKVIAAMEIPATWKITFGPPVMKQAAGMHIDTSRGSLLRVYDGKLQRGVIPNVIEFFAQDEISYSEITIK